MNVKLDSLTKEQLIACIEESDVQVEDAGDGTFYLAADCCKCKQTFDMGSDDLRWKCEKCYDASFGTVLCAECYGTFNSWEDDGLMYCRECFFGAENGEDDVRSMKSIAGELEKLLKVFLARKNPNVNIRECKPNAPLQ